MISKKEKSKRIIFVLKDSDIKKLQELQKLTGHNRAKLTREAIRTFYITNVVQKWKRINNYSYWSVGLSEDSYLKKNLLSRVINNVNHCIYKYILIYTSLSSGKIINSLPTVLSYNYLITYGHHRKIKKYSDKIRFRSFKC